MSMVVRNCFVGAAVVGAICAAVSASAQDSASNPANASASGEAPDEVVVRGDRSALRLELMLAEQAVYLRFNEINSDDRFDIHCSLEERIGTRIKYEVCQSNDWREKNAQIGQSMLARLRGDSAVPAEAINAEQLAVQRQLREEMARLAYADEELLQALRRLGNAQQAFSRGTVRPGELSVSRPMDAGAAALPHDASHVVEVKIGRQAWVHGLRERTFTIADVSGEVDKIEVRCDQGRDRFDYEPDVDWSLPESWTRCALRVTAEPETTFRLYEFSG